MRFVKEKSFAILVGDTEIEKSVNGTVISINSLTHESFSYNNQAKKNIRLHSRKTSLVLECMHLLDFESFRNDFHPDEIGFYVNTSQNVQDFEMPDLVHQNEKSIYLHYKEILQPTYNIKNVSGILPGHVCIFHEIHGPSCAITSMPAAQIFSRAKLDLESGLIKCAVIALINTYDDPLVVHTHQRLAGEKKICEAAGVYFLTLNSKLPNETNDEKNFYGYLDTLIAME